MHRVRAKMVREEAQPREEGHGFQRDDLCEDRGIAMGVKSKMQQGDALKRTQRRAKISARR
jgi:hypothetical protein